MTLTTEQKRVLLAKHLTGEFPGQKWETVKGLLNKGALAEQNKTFVVTEQGRAFCESNHLSM